MPASGYFWWVNLITNSVFFIYTDKAHDGSACFIVVQRRQNKCSWRNCLFSLLFFKYLTFYGWTSLNFNWTPRYTMQYTLPLIHILLRGGNLLVNRIIAYYLAYENFLNIFSFTSCSLYMSPFSRAVHSVYAKRHWYIGGLDGY